MGRLEEAGVRLCDWFDAHMRQLPWRESRDPYRIWISEVMLQQTRVETVIGYFLRFTARFPRVEDLAAAPRDEVFKLWEGLGYYRRAELLMKGARYVTEELGGVFPTTAEELVRIPGIGAYTAGAIASLAFGERVGAVDGNVLRVTARLEAYEDPIDRPEAKKKAEAISLAMMPPGREWSHTQSMMELGACVCLPKNPRCNLCPIQALCRAYERGQEQLLPIKAPKKKQTVVRRTVYMITDGENVFLRRRPETGLLAGMWEFPAEEGDRSVRARFSPISCEKVLDAHHVFTHRVWEMEGWWMAVAPDTPVPEGWIRADRQQLEALALPSAMAAFRAYSREHLP